MVSSRFHAAARYVPGAGGPIDFSPRRQPCLTRACDGQNDELKAPGADAFNLAQPRHKVEQVALGNSRVAFHGRNAGTFW